MIYDAVRVPFPYGCKYRHAVQEHGTIAQVLDYYPYGQERINNGTDANRRHYIGQMTDAGTSLSYLNTRYYDSTRGQFLSEDPVFWGKQNLSDPQSFNTYSYAEGNPISASDPSGRYSLLQVARGQATWGQYMSDINDGAFIMGQNPGWNFAFNHPIATGVITAILSYPALQSGLAAGVAFKAAGDVGVGGAYAAKQLFAGLVYSMLTVAATTGTVPGTINDLGKVDLSKPSSALSWGAYFAGNIGPSIAGEYVGAVSDAIQFGGMLSNTLGSAASNLFSSSVQTRASTASSFNTAIGSGSGGGHPSNNSLWITPSGAVVTFGGQLVSAPPTKK